MNVKTNVLFACDALSLLERLDSEVVTLVYLDPPWNTASGLDFNVTKSKKMSNDNEHASYLSKIVQQVRRVLTCDGSLFVHWSLISPLDVRLVMDQVFGDRAKNEITWYRKRLVNLTSQRLKVDNEFILIYSKADIPVYNPVYRALSPEEKSAYPLTDERGYYRVVELTVRSGRPIAQYKWRGFKLPSNISWKFPLDKLEDFAQDNRIYFPSDGDLPRLKQYIDEKPRTQIGATWDDIPSDAPSHERTEYSTQKPLALMERIVQLASSTGDLILDPFCGSGTTLVAAQSMDRYWWGVDKSDEARQITINRLNTTCHLVAGKDYKVVTENDVFKTPTKNTTYKEDVLVRIHQIPPLQKKVKTLKKEVETLKKKIKTLTQNLLKFKRKLNLPDNADDIRVENAIDEMELQISKSLAHQSVSDYIPMVCSWLAKSGWEHLEKNSQSFLLQAEMLFDGIKQSDADDYSPFIIQYCRALENEILNKLFSVYTDDIHSRIKDIASFLSEEFSEDKKKKRKKTYKFAGAILRNDISYTLGDMSFILNLMKESGDTLNGSVLLKDFREFSISHFGEHILENTYLQQIGTIVSDFRNKAAHPNILDAEVAQRCRIAVRECLNKWILNYRQGDNTDNSPLQ